MTKVQEKPVQNALEKIATFLNLPFLYHLANPLGVVVLGGVELYEKVIRAKLH